MHYPGDQDLVKSMNCCPAQLTTAHVFFGNPLASKIDQDMLFVAGIRATFVTSYPFFESSSPKRRPIKPVPPPTKENSKNAKIIYISTANACLTNMIMKTNRLELFLLTFLEPNLIT